VLVLLAKTATIAIRKRYYHFYLLFYLQNKSHILILSPWCFLHLCVYVV